MSADSLEPELEPERRAAAERRASEKFEFFGHLSAYIVVMSVLAYISLAAPERHYWFLWVLFGWGIGIVRHGMRVFGRDTPLFRRMVNREVHRSHHG